jgi:hypothetical protein
MDAESMTPDSDEAAAGRDRAGPGKWARAVAIGLLAVALPIALIVVLAMAGSAAATGGCGGG